MISLFLSHREVCTNLATPFRFGHGQRKALPVAANTKARTQCAFGEKRFGEATDTRRRWTDPLLQKLTVCVEALGRRRSRTFRPAGDIVKANRSRTSSASPALSTLKFLYSIESNSFISRNARRRPGQMRAPEPNGKCTDASCTPAVSSSQRSGRKALGSTKYPRISCCWTHKHGDTRARCYEQITNHCVDFSIEEQERGDWAKTHRFV